MSNFYDKWLEQWSQFEQEKAAARRSIHAEEVEWVETVQDQRAALLISRETGFRTMGTTTMIAEIPPHSHSGAHKHGEEGIFILEGDGYSVVDNVRYNWKKDSAVLIPFGSVHQHFNTGETTAKYLSILCPDLEYFCGLQRTIQIESWGATTVEPDIETSPDGMTPSGEYRVVLHREGAHVNKGEGDGVPVLPDYIPEYDPEHPIVRGEGKGQFELPAGFGKSVTLQYMRLNKDMNGFHPTEVEVSGLLTDPPHEYGGMHAHMEAHLYIVEGEGHTVMDGEKVAWKPGTAFQVPGPQTAHRHVNESDVPSVMVRLVFGVRYFWQKAAQREFPYLYLAPRQAVLEKSGMTSGRMWPA